MIKGIIFDLDGTLLNTLGDLTSAVNKLMINNGYPTYSEDDVRIRIGKGFKNLISRCIPIEIEDCLLDKKVEEFKSYYFSNLIDKTKPYVGINELINELKKRDIKIGVNSNKGNEPTKELIKYFFNLNDDYVLGKREGFNIKPDPANNNEIISKMNLNKDEILYVGDSSVDYLTGLNSNLKTVLVSWGFVDKKDLLVYDVTIIDKPSELLSIIDKEEGRYE